MESNREKIRTKFYRTLAWVISIAVHGMMIYGLLQYNPSPERDQKEATEVVVAIK